MKKSKILIVLSVMCCLLLFTFAACDKKPTDNGGGTGSGAVSGDTTEIKEIEEFRHILDVVIKEFKGKANPTAVQANSVEFSTEQYAQKGSVEKVYELLDACDNKTDGSEYESMCSDLALDGLVTMLAYVETLNEVCGIEDIYGVPMKNVDANDFNKGYVTVLAKGTCRTIYLYMYENGEVVYKYDIDFINDEEFSVSMIMLYMNELKTDGTKDSVTSSYYCYADTDDAFLIMLGDWTENTNSDSDLVAYKKNSQSDIFCVEDSQVLNNCFKAIKDDYAAIELQLLRDMKNNCSNSFTEQQYEENYKKLSEKYGIN